VLTIDGDVKRVVKVEDENGSVVSVKDFIGFWMTGNQDPSASFGRGNASVGFCELCHFLFQI
jgi:hypothetical protein